jgi:bacillithiol biosynthesis cysteine-adding enzyme BshC
MNVMQQPIPNGQPLAEALIHKYESVSHLYESNAFDEASWTSRMDWLDRTENLRIDRKKLVGCLTQFNQKYNNHEGVHTSLSLLEQPGTLVISGGQQSGLFTGPLLVIYKTISIIKAAQYGSELLKRPVVPVFWIAGEDHDWDEVNHTYVLSPDLQINRIRLTREDQHRSPVSAVNISEEMWNSSLTELESLLAGSEFKEQLLAELGQLCRESDTLTIAFAKLLGKWFGKYGLILLDSADEGLRKLESPVFEAIIEQNDELEQAYLATAKEVAKLGLTAQADVVEGGANLFYIHGENRLLLFKQEGRFADRKQQVSFTKDELLAELQQHPERFSNNVLTRPLMQDSLLPVLGAVLGGGEIAYWGLTGKAFQVLGLQMPILLPRMSFTVIEGTLHKHMNKYDLKWEDIISPEKFSNKRKAWLSEQDQVHVEEQFANVKASFTAMYEPLIEQLSQIQAGLLKLGNANKDKIIDQIEYLQNRAMDALARSNEAGMRHFDRIEYSLYPQHKPQERVYNVFYYLNRYGEGWIDQLMEIPFDVTGSHCVIYV